MPQKIYRPGSLPYEQATTPFNQLARQRPAAVARVHDTDDAHDAIQFARRQGLRVVVQATGHSAIGQIGSEALLINTRGLDEVTIDPRQQVARVGAGARWDTVQSAAERVGLIGLAGSASSVGVAGYTFGGGVGWLVRPHGMASPRLRSVDYLDAAGQLRHASEDATDPIDREALWAFRGGGGVGIATRVEFGLVPFDHAWGGMLLWPADDASEIASAWPAATALPGVSSALTMLRMPPAPEIPTDLHGRVVVRLLLVAPAALQAPAITQLLDDVPRPLMNTLGPANATRLAALHLDPPGPVTALGDGRWLTATAIEQAATIITAAGADDDFALNELELRHVAPDHQTTESGALVAPPAPILSHAVGPADTNRDRHQTTTALTALDRALRACDTGQPAAGFSDGRHPSPPAFDEPTRRRLAAIHQKIDPDHLIQRPAQHRTPDPAQHHLSAY